MNRYTCYLVVCVLLHVSFSSCKKDLMRWERVEQLETFTNNRLNRILLLPDGRGVIAGGEKFGATEVLFTNDHGENWQRQYDPGAGKAMYGLAHAPDGNFYMCGFDGKLVSGSGNDWRFTQLNSWKYYVDVAFPGPDRGFLISTVVYAEGTVDHVDSAGNITPGPSFKYGLNDIEMIDQSTGYISGYGVVMKTTDSGKTWQAKDIQNDNFTAVHAYGPNEAWTCGYNGSIFHTSDGGASWQRMRNGNDIKLPRYRLLDILFIDPTHGFAVGENGLVIFTDDGGRHWMEFDRFTDSALRSLAKMKDGSLLVCGDNGSLFRLLPRYLQ